MGIVLRQWQRGRSEEEVAEKEGVSELWSQYVFSLFEILKAEKHQLKEEGRKELLNSCFLSGSFEDSPGLVGGTACPGKGN